MVERVRVASCSSRSVPFPSPRLGYAFVVRAFLLEIESPLPTANFAVFAKFAKIFKFLYIKGIYFFLVGQYPRQYPYIIPGQTQWREVGHASTRDYVVTLGYPLSGLSDTTGINTPGKQAPNAG